MLEPLEEKEFIGDLPALIHIIADPWAANAGHGLDGQALGTAGNPRNSGGPDMLELSSLVGSCLLIVCLSIWIDAAV